MLSTIKRDIRLCFKQKLDALHMSLSVRDTKLIKHKLTMSPDGITGLCGQAPTHGTQAPMSTRL